MPYQCKLCSSLEVYHSCATVLRAAGAASLTTFSDVPHAAPVTVAGCVTVRSDAEATFQQPALQQPHLHVVKPRKQLADEPQAQPNNAHLTSESDSSSMCKHSSCTRCGAQSSTDYVYGMKWCFASQQRIRVRGDRLCRDCRNQLCDDLADYIPMPPSMPGAYLVVRSRHMKRVSRKDGITMLWLSGQYLAAKELSGRSALTVSRRIV